MARLENLLTEFSQARPGHRQPDTRRAARRRREAHAIAFLETAIQAVDAVIVADCSKGYLTQTFADRICALAAQSGRIVAIDPHSYTSIVRRGATAIKPNRLEAFLAAGLPPAEPVTPLLEHEALLEARCRLLERWGPRTCSSPSESMACCCSAATAGGRIFRPARRRFTTSLEQATRDRAVRAGPGGGSRAS